MSAFETYAPSQESSSSHLCRRGETREAAGFDAHFSKPISISTAIRFAAQSTDSVRQLWRDALPNDAPVPAAQATQLGQV
jgi:hypothetical protein